MAAIQARNFQSNSLSGVVSVTNGFANLALLTNPFALEGNKSFVIKLRKGSILGDVVATSPAITLQDNSSFVSLTANTSSVNEGNLVQFTLVTANAINGSTLFYSVSPVTGNLTISDFYNGSNTGYITLNNNQATFALYANTDSGYVDETGETFRVQIRSDSITGNVVYASTSNVSIVDSYKLYNIISIVESANPVMEYNNINFTITGHNIPTGTLLYYSIGGNVGTFALGNTGSFLMNTTSNILTFSMPSIPSQQSRVLTLDVRKDSPTGEILRSSNAITVIDAALAYNSISGGTEFNIGDGYKTHVFATSANLTISSVGTQYSSINYLVVAGGGGGGGGSSFNNLGGGGGGAGGYISGNLALSSTGIVPIIIGGGGSGGPGGNAFGVNGSNTILSGGINFTAVGGGYGAADQYDGRPGNNGGSGGGSIYSAGSTGQGYPGQGFPGGLYGNPVRVGGSGGGAGGASPMNPVGINGPGGIGKVFEGSPSAYGTPGPTSGQWFAGGGGGGDSPAQSGGVRTGGSGGGGAGAPTGTGATPGTTNTGGGGGGGNSGTTGGNGGSGIVIIRYPYNVATYTNVVYPAGFSTISATSNITFTLNALNANLQTLYYTTEGNVTTSDFIGGNTGSFVANASGAVFTLRANSTVAATSTKQFALQIRDGSTSGDVVATSSNVTIAGLNLYYIQATGGDTVYLTSDGYKVHTYNTSSTFNVTSFGASTIEYLVIAGGGAGGAGFPGYSGIASGGGAGGYLEGSAVLPSTGAYIVTVGAGAASSTGAARGSNGSNSNIFNPGLSVVALGGGGGGGGNMGSSFPGSPGGSGGGANGNGSQGSGTPGQGYPGGVGYNSSDYGGGGGGAGGAAQNGAPSYSSTGGPGATSSITGTSVVRAGGGTGGRAPNAGSGSPPAGGGGGTGGFGGSVPPTAGLVNSGGGGGGAAPNQGGSGGGSGIVIIRYPFGLPYFTGLTISSLSSNVLVVGSNITFDLAVQGANTRTLYYSTEGNVDASYFIGGNTGSFIANATGSVITLRGNSSATVPAGQTRNFRLQVREDSTTGFVWLSSANVVLMNSADYYVQATGGTATIDSGGYRMHVFTSSANLTVTSVGVTGLEYLLVAGGGGGGTGYFGFYGGGGGGGAGGLLNSPFTIPTTGNIIVTIGGGGNNNSNGANTTLSGIVSANAYGGGGGVSASNNGRPGGSGGGGATSVGGSSYGSGIPGQGYRGGLSSPVTTGGANNTDMGGGGGGAGEIGHWTSGDPTSPTTGTVAGGGGLAISWVPASYGTPGPTPSRWFAGGGGGGDSPNGYAARQHGGAGGGGYGGSYYGSNGAQSVGLARGGTDGGGNAGTNTGGGGGGVGAGGAASGTGLPGLGGSGIVIIRYPYV